MSATLGWFALGMLLLTLGADSLVKGAGGLALRLGLRPFAVGMVAVGIGTSVPALAVTLVALRSGRSDLAMGNLVGANLAHIGVVLAICTLVSPLVVGSRTLRIGAPSLLVVSLLFAALALDGTLSSIDGLVLLAGFGLVLAGAVWCARSEPEAVRQQLAAAADTRSEPWRSAWRIAVGLVALAYGAVHMVDSSVALARTAGVDEGLVGCTLLAIGTALPVLASSLVATLRGLGDVALGHVVASNLINLLLIAGGLSLLRPYAVPGALLGLGIPALAVAAAALYAVMAAYGRVDRRSGGAMLAGYAMVLAWQVVRAST